MKRMFGEISHFRAGENEYILRMERYPYAKYYNMDIPWPNFRITNRTAKTIRKDLFKTNRVEATYSLLGDTKYSEIRKIVSEVKKYLDENKPPFIAVNAHDDDKEKREKLYEKALNSLGWIIYDIENDEYCGNIYIFKKGEK